MNDMNTTAPNAIEVRHLNFFYGKFQGLRNIHLDIAEKKVTAFIGPSGCGKSTLLRTLNREARKEILKERPSGEFLEMLNQVYAATAA